MDRGMKKNLLITGRPGVGKTTLVMKAIEVSGLNARGFYTREIRIGGERKGFKVKTFSGRDCTLGHVEYKGKERVGKYGVDVGSFEGVALPEVAAALKGCQIIVIDEIGKMELFSQKFRDLVIMALDSPYPLLGVIKESGNGFIQKIKAREDVRLFHLTMDNRESLLKEILDSLKGMSGS